MAYKSEKQKVTIFLEPEEKAQLRKVAKEQGRSMASQARQAVLQSMAPVTPAGPRETAVLHTSPRSTIDK